MRVPPLVCLCFFPEVFLSSRVTGACPVTTDLIMRVDVRTTTTLPFQGFQRYCTRIKRVPGYPSTRLGEYEVLLISVTGISKSDNTPDRVTPWQKGNTSIENRREVAKENGPGRTCDRGKTRRRKNRQASRNTSTRYVLQKNIK